MEYRGRAWKRIGAEGALVNQVKLLILIVIIETYEAIPSLSVSFISASPLISIN